MTTIIAELYDALREAGVADETAKAAARAVIGLEHAATKSDISDLRADLKTAMAATQADIAASKADLKTAVAELKAEIYRALWIQGGAIITILAGIGTLLRVWPL
jgi:hypothetical protein